jgi:hypothetical protein
MIVRYLNNCDDAALYDRLGWDVQWYAWRGDDLPCFSASFKCCGPVPLPSQRVSTGEVTQRALRGSK